MWCCAPCKLSKTDYPVVEKKARIVSLDKNMVKKAFFSGGKYDENGEGVVEYFYDQINIYLDYKDDERNLPYRVDAIVFDGTEKKTVDSTRIEIMKTELGAGLVIQKRFYGSEKRLIIFVYPDERMENKKTLEFILEQKSEKTWHSKCIDSYYQL